MITVLFQGVNIFNVIIQFKTVDMMLKGKSCLKETAKVMILFMEKSFEILFF